MIYGILFLGAILALCVGLFFLNINMKKALRQAFESAGFEIVKGGTQAIEEIAGCAPLPEGVRARYIVDWWGTSQIDDHEVTLISHRTLRRMGKSVETVYTMIVSVECPAAWPGFRLTGGTLFSRIAAAAGFKDLKVENATFNKRWNIRTDDEGFAILVLTPEMQEWLLEAPKKESWTILEGHLVCAWHRRLKPKDVDQFVHRVTEFRRHLPPELDAWTAPEAGEEPAGV